MKIQISAFFTFLTIRQQETYSASPVNTRIHILGTKPLALLHVTHSDGLSLIPFSLTVSLATHQMDFTAHSLGNT